MYLSIELFVSLWYYGGEKTFSKFAWALLLTFMFEMLTYLKLGDKMHIDKGQT